MSVSGLPAINLDLGAHRIASQEAVSLDARLALVALRRGQVETTIMDRLARVAEVEPPLGTGIVVDKIA
ncbi:hypothetical protein VE25_06975 [Devosia geojensis]|uniref:Uncharacterized protein n=1 Tax=Devosia geojensis TaxID=443610 RepID=A0A0F5FVA2_9HYPH|nr:hypothetical protein [Devosia geojensis]KKB12505.1 hypothetical protein VE25_06975 [Devosia geojensis]